MHIEPSRSGLRRAATLGALAALLTLASWRAGAAEAPPPDGPAASASAPVVATTTAPSKAKTVHLVYIENELRTPGLATPTERDETLVDYRYFEMSRYLQERAPLVLAANALAGDVTIVPPQAADAPLKLTFAPDEPVVVVTATSYSKRKQLFKTWAGVSFSVTPVGAPSNDRIIRSLGITLGPDPVLGVLRINRLDPSMVDWMVAEMLTIAADKGLLALPQAKAVRPPAAS